MMKCDMCGMMMKDENEHRMHMEMMRSMMMHMMKCCEMGMEQMHTMMGGMQGGKAGGSMQGGMSGGAMQPGMNAPNAMGGGSNKKSM